MPIKSKYKGVSIRTTGKKKFYASVTCNKVIYPCGHWDTEIEAVKARDLRIIKLNLPVATQVIHKLRNEQDIL